MHDENYVLLVLSLAHIAASLRKTFFLSGWLVMGRIWRRTTRMAQGIDAVVDLRHVFLAAAYLALWRGLAAASELLDHAARHSAGH